MKRLITLWIMVSFIASLMVAPSKGHAQEQINLPEPGTMLATSPNFSPVIITGMIVHPENPLQFDFIVDTGDDHLRGKSLKSEAHKLVNYFMAALTIPEDERWVNLSPYEKNRIIADGLSITEMGRDMLAQDYVLKQLTASLIYPESRLGKEFWEKIYAKTQEQFGTTKVPTNLFNKVWIVPQDATVYVHGNNVFVTHSHLKVMLEEDYVSLEKHTGISNQSDGNKIHNLGSRVVREVVLPALENEVNKAKNFANLRQIFNSIILATWYKKKLKDSILSHIYFDKNKTNGIELKDKSVKAWIYHQYLLAYKKGVYNFIKEELDPQTKQVIPRKYFSGGVVGREENIHQEDLPLDWVQKEEGRKFVRVETNEALLPVNASADNAAMAKRRGPGEGRPVQGDSAQLSSIWDDQGRLNKDGILLAHATAGFPINGILRPNSYFGGGPVLLRYPRELVEFSWNNIIHFWTEASYVVLLPFKDVANRQWVNMWFNATAYMGPFELPRGARIMVREGADIPKGQAELLRSKGIEIIFFKRNSFADKAAKDIIKGMGYRPTRIMPIGEPTIRTTWIDDETGSDYARPADLDNLGRSIRALADGLGIPSAENTENYDIGYLTLGMERLHEFFIERSVFNPPSINFQEFDDCFQRVRQKGGLRETEAGRRFLTFVGFYRDIYWIYNMGAMKDGGNALTDMNPENIDYIRKLMPGKVHMILVKRSSIVHVLNELFGINVTPAGLDFFKIIKEIGETRSKGIPDPAMASDVGGIDFNADNFNLKEQGNSATVSFQNLQNIHADEVSGILPMITNIQPVYLRSFLN